MYGAKQILSLTLVGVDVGVLVGVLVGVDVGVCSSGQEKRGNIMSVYRLLCKLLCQRCLDIATQVPFKDQARSILIVLTFYRQDINVDMKGKVTGGGLQSEEMILM